MGIALVGYWSTGTPGWPPTWEDAMDEEPEDLGLVMLHLGVNEERYAQFVEVTRKLMADPLFIRLRNAIARALTHVPVLERQDLEALAAIHLSEIGSKQWSI